MKTKNYLLISVWLTLVLILTACNIPVANQTNSVINSFESQDSLTGAVTPTPTLFNAPTLEAAAAQTPEEEQSPQEASVETNTQTAEEAQSDVDPETPLAVGPEDFPVGSNPLTGLPVADPSLLDLPPALISISNFPASARPQAGLNASAITFEIAIGEGMTRFLAMFYGEFPKVISGQTEGQTTGSASSDDTTDDQNTENTEETDENAADTIETASIGPIRSGRLPYEDIRSAYSGFLVMASAWEGVAKTLNDASSVYGSDEDDINSAMVGVDKLVQMAENQADSYLGSNFNLEGMSFSSTPPGGGKPADNLWVFYSALNQIQWKYDREIGAYIRYDIKTDGSGEFVMSTDSLTGEPLSKENVIVIFAEHDYLAPTLIDINLKNQHPTKALLLRDGEIHEIYWTTQYGEYEQQTGRLRPIRFVDATGEPVALKPGQTWVHVVSMASYAVESVLNDTPFYPVIEQPNTGLWLIRYKGKY